MPRSGRRARRRRSGTAGPSPAGLDTSAWIVAAGAGRPRRPRPGTDGGAAGPGGVEHDRAAGVERITGGSAEEDQANSTVPSGRAVAGRSRRAACRSAPARRSPGRSGTARRGAWWEWETSSADASGYQSAPTSPGRSREISSDSPATGSQTSGSGRPRRSCSTSSRWSPAYGREARPLRPLPAPSHRSATVDAVGAHDPQRHVPAVAVLAVVDARRADSSSDRSIDVGVLGVRVQHARLAAGHAQVDARAAVLGRAADHREAAGADGEPGRVGRLQVGRRRRVGAAAERLALPHPELVAVGVGEPPDPLARRVDAAHPGAVGAVGDLAVRAGRAVPGVDLPCR